VILWGALVRASKSGEGCGDHWPLCNGTVVPHGAAIATMIEFTHRVSTALALILVIVMAIWAYRAVRAEPAWHAAVWSVVFIFTEALLGAGLVLFKYVGQDASIGRAVYLSTHLINTFLMLGAIALAGWWGSGHLAPQWNGNRQRAALLGIATLAVLALGVSGATTALGDTLFPSVSLRDGWVADFSSTSHAFIRMRIWHAVMAALAGGYVVVLAVAISREAPQSARPASAVVSLVAAQLAAGFLNVWFLAPVWMQLIHLLLADLLWIALVLFAAAALEPEAARERVLEPRHDPRAIPA
jgi:cytochrome c oxidase assembly protein subunit 15